MGGEREGKAIDTTQTRQEGRRKSSKKTETKKGKAIVPSVTYDILVLLVPTLLEKKFHFRGEEMGKTHDGKTGRNNSSSERGIAVHHEVCGG